MKAGPTPAGIPRATPSAQTELAWWRGWPPLAVLPGAVVLLTPPAWPRWAFMWALAFAIFCGCKWLTWRRTRSHDASVWRHIGYLAAWPGLDAVAFLDPGRHLPRSAPREWLLAACRLACGVLLLFGVTRLLPAREPYVAGWVGMVGMVMVLHFGFFHLLACAWRRAGVEARPLMNRPLVSVSLSEFWGRRWNTAFRDLTHRFLFRPLTPRVGAIGAVLAGFAISGLVHDAVISWPSGGGYGAPTVYFLLQGVGIVSERSPIGRALGLGKGWRGRLFTMSMLLAPVGLLFHRPFVLNVIVPFLGAAGAI